MNFVLDASATLAWIVGDEDHDQAWPVVESLRDSLAFAPAHYPLEVANGLLTAMRRGRLTPDQAATAVVALAAMPIEVDAETPGRAFAGVWKLAVSHRLSIYDAAYLDLAIRRQLPLATLDESLARAASAEEIALAIPRH